MTLHPIARRAANLARMWPSLGRTAGLKLAEIYGVPLSLLTTARVLACAELNNLERGTK